MRVTLTHTPQMDLLLAAASAYTAYNLALKAVNIILLSQLKTHTLRVCCYLLPLIYGNILCYGKKMFSTRCHLVHL